MSVTTSVPTAGEPIVTAFAVANQEESECIAMKELYIQPEVEILLPLTEDIMTSSGNVPGPGDKPTNPDAALPSDPATPGTDNTPSDSYEEPDTAPDLSGGDVDTGVIA